MNLDPSRSELVTFGIAGPHAQKAMENALGEAPNREFEVTHIQPLSVITLPGSRFLVACPASEVSPTWSKLTAHMRAAGWNAWQLQSIRAGIASVTAATQDAFLPQMLALEAHDGVSFTKGCYPGQEIVARTRYRGDLKRHLYHGRCSRSLAAGNAIVAEDTNTNVGVVTDAAANADGDWEFLAVIGREAVNSSGSLRCSDGTAVTDLTRAGTTEGARQ